MASAHNTHCGPITKIATKANSPRSQGAHMPHSRGTLGHWGHNPTALWWQGNDCYAKHVFKQDTGPGTARAQTKRSSRRFSGITWEPSEWQPDPAARRYTNTLQPASSAGWCLGMSEHSRGWGQSCPTTTTPDCPGPSTHHTNHKQRPQVGKGVAPACSLEDRRPQMWSPG